MIDILKGRIILNNKQDLLNSFDRLPGDKYIKYPVKNYRLRRFSKCIINENIIKNIDDKEFHQKKLNNRFLGGVKRLYLPIEKKIFNNFTKMIIKNFNFITENKKLEIGLHQIRVSCGSNYVGYPVPEGWHRDGFDYVSIINFRSSNIEGGISRIRSNIGQNADTYSCFLKSGEYLFFNDKKFYHFADPINVTKSKKSGYRDILVITFKNI